VVICLSRGADCLHMVQVMPLHSKTLNPSISCLIYIQTGFTFLVPAYRGPGKEAVKWVYLCVIGDFPFEVLCRFCSSKIVKIVWFCKLIIEEYFICRLW